MNQDFMRRVTISVWVAIFSKLAFGTHPSASVAIITVGCVYAAWKALAGKGM